MAVRFEAYTRRRSEVGYYALPLLWRERVIGWANVSVKDGALAANSVTWRRGAPRDRVFRRELAAELERMRSFLRI